MLPGEKDGGHASPADLPLDRVAVTQNVLNFVD